MKTPLEVLVVDDDKDFLRRVCADIKKAAAGRAQVNQLTGDDLRSRLAALQQRRESAREKAREKRAFTPEASEFDNADVLVVDFDLLGVPGLSIANGADVAYLARCYSDCGVIVLLNRYGDRTFDLTLERGARDFMELNHVDLNLGARQVDNPYIWTGERGGTFAPWSWTDLPSAVTRLRKRTGWIEKRLRDGVADALNPVLREVLARDMHAALQLKRERATWEEWASDACLRTKDRLASDHDKARVAAARIGNWLDHVVLPTQDVLVDAPHLVSRYPALLHDPSAADDWNTTNGAAQISPRMKAALVRSGLFKDWPLWLSRPAWSWATVREHALGKPWEPVPSDSADVVFCEDTATFVRSKQAHPFICGLRTPFARRYIQRVRDVSYEPQVRLLSGSV